MPTTREIFEAWAPESSPWSKFAKPVLFAHVNERQHDRAQRPIAIDLTRLADPDAHTYREAAHHSGTMLIVDLAGAASVGVGVTAAHAGFRPVPLFNALPGEKAIVEVWPIVAALEQFAEEVRSAKAPPNAPPAFLLDADRIGYRPRNGIYTYFDNRSVCFPTDFPSAGALTSAGISRVVIISSDVSYDLLAIVEPWKRGGIAVDRMALDGTVTEARTGIFDWFKRIAAGYDRGNVLPRRARRVRPQAHSHVMTA